MTEPARGLTPIEKANLKVADCRRELKSVTRSKANEREKQENIRLANEKLDNAIADRTLLESQK